MHTTGYPIASTACVGVEPDHLRHICIPVCMCMNFLTNFHGFFDSSLAELRVESNAQQVCICVDIFHSKLNIIAAISDRI